MFPFVSDLLQLPLEPFLNVASQGGDVDLILDFYVENLFL